MSRNVCPMCGDLLVNSTGNGSSKILILGDSPDYEDVRTGVCLSGDVGDMLRGELAKVGLQLASIKYTNIWQHLKKEKGCDLAWHVDQALKHIEGKTHVLVMGSDGTRALFGKNAGDISGITMKSKLYPKVVFVPSPNAATLFHSDLGEFRLALSRFAALIGKGK